MVLSPRQRVKLSTPSRPSVPYNESYLKYLNLIMFHPSLRLLPMLLCLTIGSIARMEQEKMCLSLINVLDESLYQRHPIASVL